MSARGNDGHVFGINAQVNLFLTQLSLDLPLYTPAGPLIVALSNPVAASPDEESLVNYSLVDRRGSVALWQVHSMAVSWGGYASILGCPVPNEQQDGAFTGLAFTQLVPSSDPLCIPVTVQAFPGWDASKTLLVMSVAPYPHVDHDRSFGWEYAVLCFLGNTTDGIDGWWPTALSFHEPDESAWGTSSPAPVFLYADSPVSSDPDPHSVVRPR